MLRMRKTKNKSIQIGESHGIHSDVSWAQSLSLSKIRSAYGNISARYAALETRVNDWNHAIGSLWCACVCVSRIRVKKKWMKDEWSVLSSTEPGAQHSDSLHWRWSLLKNTNIYSTFRVINWPERFRMDKKLKVINFDVENVQSCNQYPQYPPFGSIPLSAISCESTTDVFDSDSGTKHPSKSHIFFSFIRMLCAYFFQAGNWEILQLKALPSKTCCSTIL